MDREASCSFEEIYPNMDLQATEEANKQYTTKLIDEPSSKKNFISIYCAYIYNYLLSCFFPHHINSLYE